MLLEKQHPELVVSSMKKELRAREGVRRLEPERRPQDDRLRLLAARARAADGLDAGAVGGGRGSARQRATRSGSCSRPARCSSGSRSTVTCSRPCSSSRQRCRSSPPRFRPLQRKRVADRVAVPVVVEVGEDLDLRAPGRDPRRQLLELAGGVVAVAAARAVVEAHEGPVRRSARRSGTGAPDGRRSRARRRAPGAAGRRASANQLSWRNSKQCRPAGSCASAAARRSSSRRKVPGSCHSTGPSLPRLAQRLDPLVEALDSRSPCRSAA